MAACCYNTAVPRVQCVLLLACTFNQSKEKAEAEGENDADNDNETATLGHCRAENLPNK